jgi:hypothetical protein
MSSERRVRTPVEIDPALFAAHPELAVLTLDLSPSTRHVDQTTKKTLYEQTFKTREYYPAIPDADAARLHTYLSWWPVRSVCRPAYMTYPLCRSAMHAPIVHVPVWVS